jgi:hypothetical protein
VTICSTAAPRKVIRGYKQLRPFTGLDETRLRELIEAGDFPPPIKGERALSGRSQKGNRNK